MHYRTYKSLIISIEITLLFVLLTALEGGLWFFAPIAFPILFAFVFGFIDRAVWQWYYTPMNCLMIFAYYTFVINYVGTHDDVGTVLIEIAHSLTFLLTYAVAAVIKTGTIKSNHIPNETKTFWKRTFKELTLMLVPFIGSYMVLSYVNHTY
ncbi:hypothetical protein BH09BAC1_BH09BAC1_18460 [soil metagenome]